MRTYFLLLVMLCVPLVSLAGVSDVRLQDVEVSREFITHGEDTEITFTLEGVPRKNYDVVATLHGFGGVRVGERKWRETGFNLPFTYHVVGMPPSNYYLHITVVLPHSGKVLEEFNYVGPFTIMRRQ